MNRISQNSLLTKDYILLFMINFVSNAGMQIFSPILSKYAVMIGFPQGWSGLLISTFALMVFFASLISGPIIDRFNKKNLLFVAMLIQTLSVLGYALTNGNVAMLIALRLIHGFSAGMTFTVTMSMIAFVLPKNKLGSGMGIYGLGQTLAMAIAPMLGIFLVERVGYRNMFLVAFVLAAMAAAITLMLGSIKGAGRAKHKISIKHLIHIKTLPLAMISFCNTTTYAAVTAFILLHAESLGVANIGLFFTVYSIILIVSRPGVGAISDRLSLKQVVYPTAVLLVVSLLICAYATSLWMFLVSAVIMGIGFGGSQPVIQAASIRYVSPDKRGAASGTYMMGTSLGFITGPLLGGIVSASLGYNTMFAVMAGFAAVSILILTLIKTDRDQTEIPQLEVST